MTATTLLHNDARRFPGVRPALAASLVCAAASALAQPATGTVAAGWEACAAQTDAARRLACYDAWAGAQTRPEHGAATAPAEGAPAASAPASMPMTQTPPPEAGTAREQVVRLVPGEGCRNKAYSDVSRFWELEAGSSCAPGSACPKPAPTTTTPTLPTTSAAPSCRVSGTSMRATPWA